MAHQKKVLLIDDEQIMHDLATAYLERVGFKLISAYTGTSGLRMIFEERPDIVLLDYLLPGMDGEKVFAELRRNPSYLEVRDTPVVFLTAQGSDDSLKTRLIRRGITAYLQKPFGLRELSDVINNILLMTDIRRSNRLLERQVRTTRQHLSSLIQNVPIGILSISSSGDIQHANQPIVNLLSPFVDFNQQINIHHHNVLGVSFFAEGVRHVRETGMSWEKENIRWLTSDQKSLILNAQFRAISFNESGFKQTEGIMGIVDDVTERERKNFQIKLLSHIAFSMQETMELEKLMHLLLTAITAGPALSFTRAMIFLCDKQGEHLKGVMGVGPITADEAGRIWQRLANEHLDLETFLRKYGRELPGESDFLNNAVQSLQIPLLPHSDMLKLIINKKPYRSYVDSNADAASPYPDELVNLELVDFVAMPIVASDRVLGMIIADNKFSQQQIEDDRVQLLSTIASQAAHGLEKTHAYEQLRAEKQKLERALLELREAQEKLIRSERLAAIGEMAAHVAHEIRNPLVTIGGFARQLDKANQHTNEEIQPAKIIADEVLRLEKILANVLNFTKLPEPELSKNNLNKIVFEIVEQIRPEFEEKGISVQVKLHDRCPDSYFDPAQMRQVLINLLQNSEQASNRDTNVTVKTMFNGNKIEILVEDNGSGIKPDFLPEIFNPFYTTKRHGTGLGLAISQQIIHDHDGEIKVFSEVGEGTRIQIFLPLDCRKQNKDASESLNTLV